MRNAVTLMWGSLRLAPTKTTCTTFLRGCFAGFTEQPHRPTFAISPQNGTRNDLRKSEIKNFPGGDEHVPGHPLAGTLHALHYALFKYSSQVSTGTSLFKFLNLTTAMVQLRQGRRHQFGWSGFNRTTFFLQVL